MDLKGIREDFPILKRTINGRPLVYFDNAATSQKPHQVLETIRTFYEIYNSNILRSPHTLGQEATELYSQAHGNVARFIGAEDEREIVFVRSCTEGINLVAGSLLVSENPRFRLIPGDEIVLTVMEHHSNLVPWQHLRDRKGIVLKVADIRTDGTLELSQLKDLLTERTKLVCCTHASNVLGTINPVREIGHLAHEAGALFLVDGAQSVPHLPTAVGELGCDFLCFSGHKMFAPMGIGVVYGKRVFLEEMPPFQYGGLMISDVTLEKSDWNELPWKFEAGTPNACGGIALGGATDTRNGRRLIGAVDYLTDLGMDAVRAHERALTRHVLEGLMKIPEVRVYGPADPEQSCGVVSFNIEKNGQLIDGHLVARFLNDLGIAVRAGGHCAYPLTRRLGVAGTVRVSFSIYNTPDEIDYFLNSLPVIIKDMLL
ncbi:MAG TPA: cysteine desulfurase [Spirochaetia bacterium]|nr:cysteine desulfurase [Spirochaetia bacterium]